MVDTHCPYCALQCAMTVTPGKAGVTVGARDFPTNRGGLCRKGWTSAAVLTAPDRLTAPLVRRDGRLLPTTWDDALDLIADRVRALGAEFGPASVAVFGGGGLTNEKAYQLGKFARIALRTPNIDYNGRFCMSSAAAASNRSLGLDRGLAFPLSDLGDADAILLLGSNLADTMPPAVTHLAGARAAGGLIVVDPRRSATAELTDGAGMHLRPVPGTDLAVLLGLLHVVLFDDLADLTYLDARTSGLDDLRRSALAWWPERVEDISGVPAGTLREAAHLLAAASPSRGGRGAYVLTGRGVEQSTQGTATVTAAINLSLALGLIGTPGSGFGPITGQGNGQGGREHGQKADQLPGYRMITDPAARAHVAGVWGVDADVLPGPGLPAVQLLKALGTPDGPRALFVHGSNLLVSAPNATAIRERLAALDLLVVCDFLPSETARLADVVLPVRQWAEEEGTMTSLEGRVLRRRQAVEAPEGTRDELWIWAELAARLGAPGVWSTDPADVFDELARASAGGKADYSGLSHAVLDAETSGHHWPVPGPGHPGTPRVLTDVFPTPDGRARLIPVDHTGPKDAVRASAPIFLVTGRLLAHYQSGAQTRRVPELAAAEPDPYVELHPLLADRIGAAEGEALAVTSERGTFVAIARFSEAIRPDTVFAPFHFAGMGNANRATNDATDPLSGMPEFKVCAVQVRPAAELAAADRSEEAA